MPDLSLNCLPEGETLADLIRRNCAIGFDLRFCRSVAVAADDRDTVTCDPPDAAQRHEAEQAALIDPVRIA